MSVWRARCRERIAALVKDLPADATLADRRRALRGNGFTCGWAKRVWHQECSAYLARHGAKPRAGSAPLFPDHVHFPFRQGAEAERGSSAA